MKSFMLAACLGQLSVTACATGVAAQLDVTVFGEGTISKEGENAYRGQFSADGSEYWFFRKVHPDREDYRIFVSRREGAGWSEPVQVVFGGPDASEMYPTPTPDGRRIVFTSYRRAAGDTLSHSNANLWFVERRGAGWSEPVLMRGASTLSNYESQPWFDRDGALRFTSTVPDWSRQLKRRLPPGADLAAARWEDDPLLQPWSDWRRDHHIAHATPSPDGDLMVFDVVPVDASGRRGTSDVWVSIRRAGGWSDPLRLGEAVNGPDYENFPVFTPDGETLVFVRAFETVLQVPVAQVRAAAERGGR